MTDNLTKKLQRIHLVPDYVATPRNVNPTRLSDDDVEQIIQAFIDDGWTETYQGSDSTIITPKYTDDELKQISDELNKERLTREEWEAQAIAEGWAKPQVYPTFELYDCPNKIHELDLTLVCDHCLGSMMTGQEWYNRFVDEVLKMTDEEIKRRTNFMKAAKKAAGISL